jgi:hypothetical protein
MRFSAKTAVYGFAVVLLPLVVWAACYSYCTLFHSRSKPTTVLEWSGRALESDLVFDSPVTFFSPLQFYSKYLRSDISPARVLLSGPGGDGLGGWMSGLAIRWLRLPVLVTDNSLCASSCVNIFVTAQTGVIEPNGYLLFHEGVREPPLFDDCLPCNVIKTLWPWGKTPESTKHEMLGWAQELSPNLASFLKSCSKNPLDSADGIVLSGVQIKSIIEGNNDFRCDDIAFQDGKWIVDQKIIKAPRSVN